MNPPISPSAPIDRGDARARSTSSPLPPRVGDLGSSGPSTGNGLANEKSGSRRGSKGGEDADARRVEHGRAQVAVGQRVLGVLAGAAAAGEERLQRLGGELDDAVALDPARPAPLELQLPWG